MVHCMSTVYPQLGHEEEEDERDEGGEGEEEQEEEEGEGEGRFCLGQEHDSRAAREREGSEWPPDF